jgi:hypothetical protein
MNQGPSSLSAFVTSYLWHFDEFSKQNYSEVTEFWHPCILGSPAFPDFLFRIFISKRGLTAFVYEARFCLMQVMGDELGRICSTNGGEGEHL